jgi:hypothetical protein
MVHSVSEYTDLTRAFLKQTRFHDTHLTVPSLTPLYPNSHTEFHAIWTIDVDTTDRNSLTPDSDAGLSCK